jgi:exosortase
MQATDTNKDRTLPGALTSWVPAVAVGLAFLYLFRGALATMAARWEDPTFSHGWVIAPAAAVIAWVKRDTWMHLPATGSWWGLVVIVLGLLSLLVATFASVNFFPAVSMLIVVGGFILFFGGWPYMKALAFPYAFLYFMVPWPDFLLEALSVPMQQNTTTYSALLAHLINLPVQRDGVNLFLMNPDGTQKAAFEVAVACSGLRSLVALLALAAGVAYFTPVAMWKRWLLFLIGIPMAMVANIIRVFLILCVGLWISPKIAATIFHDYSAPPLFIICTLGLMGVRNWLMREPKRSLPASASAAEGTRTAHAAGTEDSDDF